MAHIPDPIVSSHRHPEGMAGNLLRKEYTFMNHNIDKEAEEFFSRLYIENYRKMLSMVAKEPSCNHTAEDLVQDTFYEALRCLPLLMDHVNPSGWLIKTARNKMQNFRRKSLVRSALEDYDFEGEISDMTDQYNLLELNVMLSDILTAQEIALFSLFYQEGYSLRELCAAEQVSLSCMKMRISRIRGKLQKAFSDNH